MHRLAHLVLSAALLGTAAARSPNHGSLRSQLEPALTFATQPAGDLGEVSVWDLILSKKADILSTCSGCQSEVCNQCAWQGHFAELITTMRAASHRTTNTCWP